MNAHITAPSFFAQLPARCKDLEEFCLFELIIADGSSLAPLATGLPALLDLKVEGVDAAPFKGRPELLQRITVLDTILTSPEAEARERQIDLGWMQVLEEQGSQLQMLEQLYCIGHAIGQVPGPGQKQAQEPGQEQAQGEAAFADEPQGLHREALAALRNLEHLQTTAILPPAMAERPLLLGQQQAGLTPEPDDMPPRLQHLVLLGPKAPVYLPVLGPCLSKVGTARMDARLVPSFLAAELLKHGPAMHH